MALRKIAVMTSGGDAPGMNAFVRAAVRLALKKNIEVYGVFEGYQGMIENKIEKLNRESVRNIIQRGGTVLKTSRSEEFMTPEGRQKAADNLNKLGIEALICCGGNGSYAGLKAFAGKEGQWQGQALAAPGTIDNDVEGTEYTIGFDTAINTAMQAIDNLRDTGDSHSRHFIVEVMGRHCGDIAQAVGKASGAKGILIPETPTDVEALAKAIGNKGHDITVVAEGDEVGGAMKLAEKLTECYHEPGEEDCKPNFRVCILGHTQRGGRPTARDRILAHDMGEYLVEKLLETETLKAVAVQHDKLCLTEL